MKTVFTTKYLQHLNSKKNKNEGFTLIELLVVIIIVGVLAAIALPSFLNQIGKARGSEAKSTIGTLNRAQQAFRLENGSFASQVTDLDAKISPKFFTYTINNAAQNYVGTRAVADSSAGSAATDLKAYSSGASQAADGSTFNSVICESIDNSSSAEAMTAYDEDCSGNGLTAGDYKVIN